MRVEMKMIARASYGWRESHLQAKALVIELVKALCLQHFAEIELQLADGGRPHNPTSLQRFAHTSGKWTYITDMHCSA